MSRTPSAGKTFIRTLIVMLSCVLIMATFSFVIIIYQNDQTMQLHIDMLKTAMGNGAEQIDSFLESSVSLLMSLNEGNYLQNLVKQPEILLKERTEAQEEAVSRLSTFLIGANHASDAYIYLYGKDYLITSEGVTNITTYFNNRYSGDANELIQLLRQNRALTFVKLPFEVKDTPYYSTTSLALMQTIYNSSNRAIGCFVVAIDSEVLEQTAETYFTIHNTHAILLLNGEPLTDALSTLGISIDNIPTGNYVSRIDDIGIVVRKSSSVIGSLEYLAIDEESNIISERNQLLMSLELIVILMTLIMGGIAFIAARQLYKPMKMLLRELDKPVTAHTDECRLLLQSIRNANESYVNARHDLDVSSPLIRDALLYHLLRGGKADEQHLFELCMPASQHQAVMYYVFVLAISFPSGNDDNELNGVVQRFADMFGQAALSVLRTSDDEFSIVTQPISLSQYRELCQSADELCKAINNEKRGGVVIFADGGGNAGIELIGKSFHAARTLIRQRPITSDCAFLNADTETHGKSSITLPSNYTTTFAALLNSGTLEKACAFIDEILDKNRKPDISAVQYIKLAMTLNQQLIWTAREQIPSTESRLIEISAPHALVTADQLKDILHDNLAIFYTEKESTQSCIDDSDIKSVIQYIRDNFSNGINLAETAEHFGYSSNYFSRYFKQKIGVNFIAYLNRVKIEEACRLLRSEQQLSVREIAQKCGYNSSQQFIISFEKLIGMTPGAYRSQIIDGADSTSAV